MSSLCQPLKSASWALILAFVAAQSTPAGAQSNPPPTDSGREFVPTSTLFPGGGHAPPEDPRAALYKGNPQAIADGARLFNWYNCSGCHFHGAGGMGPPLINPDWRYGGRIDQIHETLVQGRPNGMPSWGGKIPDDQLWQIAAYVRSLSSPSAANGNGESTRLPPPAPVNPAADATAPSK